MFADFIQACHIHITAAAHGFDAGQEVTALFHVCLALLLAKISRDCLHDLKRSS